MCYIVPPWPFSLSGSAKYTVCIMGGCLASEVEEEVTALAYRKNAHNKLFARVCFYVFISHNFSFVVFHPGIFA